MSSILEALKEAAEIATASVATVEHLESINGDLRTKTASLQVKISDLESENALLKKAKAAPVVELVKVASVKEATDLAQFLSARGIISQDAEELTKTAGEIQTLPETALTLLRKTANLVAPMAPPMGRPLPRPRKKDDENTRTKSAAARTGENPFIQPEWVAQ